MKYSPGVFFKGAHSRFPILIEKGKVRENETQKTAVTAQGRESQGHMKLFYPWSVSAPINPKYGFILFANHSTEMLERNCPNNEVHFY